MPKEPVIAIIDVGKTNKKIFLFDKNYKIVYEQSARFIETVDEDGFPCENVESLRQSVFDSLREVFRKEEFEIKAINFSTYGASFVCIDEHGNTVTPLYNYLKPYPGKLQEQLHVKYGGEEMFSLQTASPVLGSLNSGLQLYRLKMEKPEVFIKIEYALHLPQYLSYLITKKICSDITSIGCHTALWDFKKNDYHEWVYEEGIQKKLAPIVSAEQVTEIVFDHKWKCVAGIGLHDSSAALIPYQMSFREPFVLISTGTWCISMNPFNDTPLTVDELKQDCLCYMHYQGKPVKASRLFAGNEHEEGIKRIGAHFNQNPIKYRTIEFDPLIISKLIDANSAGDNLYCSFADRDLSGFENDEQAYHQLMLDIIFQQKKSTGLVLHQTGVKRIFVDGGFSKNVIYMNLLAAAFPQLEIYAASMAQATALGAALAIHKSWNTGVLPNDVIELKYYGAG
jgi:sugar (pentulose or hexulose) kinase